MPEKFDAIKFDEAAVKAEEDLNKILEKMTPDQRSAVTEIQGWWSKWFTTAGHKRLGRIINKI